MAQNRKVSREKPTAYLLKIDPDIDRKAVEIAIREKNYKNLARFLNAQMRDLTIKPQPQTGGAEN